MDDIDNVKENIEDINLKFEGEIEMAKLKQELIKKFSEYQKTMKFMIADAPIEILCLPKSIEKILLDQGFFRIYDLFDVDLFKIKGLGEVRVSLLTSSLDKFFSML